MKNLELKKMFKNKYFIRVAAGVVTIAVLGTSAGVSAYTVRAEQNSVVKEDRKEEDSQRKEAEETLEKALTAGTENKNAGKEETVYVVADADGSVKNVIVSEWLKNEKGLDTIEDASDLKDIENVKGNETFSQKGDKITWQAEGRDIYYQGTTDRDLPVTEKVTYFMDGREVKPEEMAGKSGKATIRFDYTNHEKTTRTVDGKEHEVYVPFTVMTGMILPEDYRNVEVTNGKVISDGDKKIVVGLAMPGLKESLAVEEGDLDGNLEIPEYVEVTADVENFSLEMSMSIIMNDLVSEASLADRFDLSGLDEDFDALTDASEQLLDGTKELSEGLGTLKDNMKEFASGAGALKDGVTSYTNGASQLNDGIHTLADSSGTLTEGVGTLNSSAAALNQGVAELDKTLKAKMSREEKNSLIQQADNAIDSTFNNTESGTEAIKNQAASVLNQVLSQAFGTAAPEMARNQKMVEHAPAAIQQALSQVAEGVEAGTQSATADAAAAAISSALAENLVPALEALAAAGQPLDAETINGAIQEICLQVAAGVKGNTQIHDGVLSQVDAQGAAAQTMAQLEGAVNEGLQSEEGKAQIQQTVNAQTQQAVAAAMANETLKAGMKDAASQIVAGIADGAKDTVGAAVADTAKTAAKTAAESATLTAVSATKSQISQAINARSEGGHSLVSGMQALSAGTQTMNDSIPALTAGISQLTNGAANLVSNNGGLTEGAGKLFGATTQIGEGVEKLAEGSVKLMDGMVQFDEEGIQKLLEAYNGDVKELLSKLEAVADAGKEYQTFTKVAEGTKGSVKFILRTEAVKEEEN